VTEPFRKGISKRRATLEAGVQLPSEHACALLDRNERAGKAMSAGVFQEAHAEAFLEMSSRGDGLYAQRLDIGGGPSPCRRGVDFCH
jgi:hypothetical protein